MTRCAVCDYLYPLDASQNGYSHHICTICEARTTREVRRALLQGQRIVSPIMDSD
jgi:hypothetical protein